MNKKTNIIIAVLTLTILGLLFVIYNLIPYQQINYTKIEKYPVNIIEHDHKIILEELSDEEKNKTCHQFDDLEKYPVSTGGELNINYISTPNYGIGGNSQEFVVLHSTQGNTCKTLDIFLDPKAEVSSHFVISEKGQIFMLVPIDFVGWHAGGSMITVGDKEYDRLNN